MGNSNAGRRVDGFVAAGLPTLRCPFLHDGHVAVDGQPGKAVHALAWRWPVDFQPIHLLALAQAENHSGVVTRHEASSGALEKAANSPFSLPLDNCPDGRWIGRPTNQLQAEPIVLALSVVVKA